MNILCEFSSISDDIPQTILQSKSFNEIYEIFLKISKNNSTSNMTNLSQQHIIDRIIMAYNRYGNRLIQNKKEKNKDICKKCNLSNYSKLTKKQLVVKIQFHYICSVYDVLDNVVLELIHLTNVKQVNHLELYQSIFELYKKHYIYNLGNNVLIKDVWEYIESQNEYISLDIFTKQTYVNKQAFLEYIQSQHQIIKINNQLYIQDLNLRHLVNQATIKSIFEQQIQQQRLITSIFEQCLNQYIYSIGDKVLLDSVWQSITSNKYKKLPISIQQLITKSKLIKYLETIYEIVDLNGSLCINNLLLKKHKEQRDAQKLSTNRLQFQEKQLKLQHIREEQLRLHNEQLQLHAEQLQLQEKQLKLQKLYEENNGS